MITKLVIFAFLTGLFSGAVITGAISWTRMLGLKMNWWKWLLAATWYVLLLFMVFAVFTIIGEGESKAGWKSLGIASLVLTILGTGLVRLIASGREK